MDKKFVEVKGSVGYHFKVKGEVNNPTCSRMQPYTISKFGVRSTFKLSK